jgi:c-di-AMP phosphodiesterase-like protein
METVMSNKNKSERYSSSAQIKRSERFHVDLSAPMIFCAVEAVVLLALCTVLRLLFKTEENAELIETVCLITFPLYVMTAGTLCLFYAVKAARIKKAKFDAKQLETEIYDMFRYIIDLPYAVMDASGKVKIINGALQDILGFKNAISGIGIDEFCTVPVKKIISFAKNRDVYVSDAIVDMPAELDLHDSAVTRLADEKRYEVISYIFKISGENYYFVVFRDVEEFLALAEHHEAESPVVAYMSLDNLEELTQYVRADYRAASAEAENILKTWVTGMNGFIREYSRDKYVAIFSKQKLDEQMSGDFEIQKKIMSMEIGDNSFPVTVSMGICSVGASLAEKDRAAFTALGIAIQRGGNQVAVRREDNTGYVFFGGTHKTMENNTTIVSRVSGEILQEKIRGASGVIIMGHANPDFDSVGSCVGMARFALSVIEEQYPDTPPASRPQVNIVVDKDAESFAICREQLAPMKIYDDIFIKREVAKDLITADTVLIICDVNNPVIYQAPELVHAVNSIAVIDHHRLAAALPYEPFLQYVETTKSSASEIVSEILFYSKFGERLHKEEAEVLLSGIMLDTQNFTRNAGAHTFQTAHYLYSRGAHTGVVREFFNESLDEMLLKGKFESAARIYRGDIAITWMLLDRPATAEDRIIASKVADNLLNIKGVKASFALIKIDNDVVISGRSKGEVNVQLILERLKGGGHFDLAGAQVKGASLTRSCEMLKEAIDDYFEYDHHN